MISISHHGASASDLSVDFPIAHIRALVVTHVSLLQEPASPERADRLVIESTYGDKDPGAGYSQAWPAGRLGSAGW